MPLSTAAKAALCICPPALLATGVATVPPVKRAVHHITAGRPHAHAAPVAARASAGPQAAAEAREDCDPGLAAGDLPAVPLVTYASPIADEPVGGVGGATLGGAASVVAAIGQGAAGGGSVTPTNPGNPSAGAIPEPSIWLMMIVGAGTLGAAFRLRRRRNASARGSARGARRSMAGGTLWLASAAVEAGDLATTVAVKSAVAGAASKAMLCVCPAAIVAGSIMAVPPLREAVHASTAGPEAFTPATAAPIRVLRPCAEAMTVPVAAMSIEGFPATVHTIAASTTASDTPLAAATHPAASAI